MRCAAKLALLLVMLAVSLVAARRNRSSAQSSRLIFQWEHMESCPELPEHNASFAFRYLRNGDIYADSFFTVVTPAKGISQVRQIITSCREDGSNCEHYMNWDAPMDGCAFVAAKSAVWSPAFANIKPPFVCPIATTRYANKNWTIDKDLLSLLPFPRNRLYKDRLEMRNESGELFWCFVLHFVFKLHKART